MKVKIFVDFDDVLLNTKKFREDYIKTFKANNVPLEVFNKYYYDYPVKKRNGRIIKYDSDEHLEIITEKEKIKTARLRSDIKKLIKKISKYIFPDVENFLRSFKKNSLYLVSYGDTRFQKNKIKNSGLKQYFEKIIIIDKLKASSIKKIIEKNKFRKEKMFFIDDRVEQIGDVKRKIPEIITIFMKRKESRHHDKKTKYCDYVAKNLIEAKKIILNT